MKLGDYLATASVAIGCLIGGAIAFAQTAPRAASISSTCPVNTVPLTAQLGALNVRLSACLAFDPATLTLSNGVLSAKPPAGAAVVFHDAENPAGVIDGTNAVFTLTQTPNAGSEHVYVNGLRKYSANGDYSISGKQITFLTTNGVSSIPQPGDYVAVDYRAGQ